MTLQELETSLPNGLHDAELLALRVDYGTQEAVFDLSIDVGDSDRPSEAPEEYRLARISFSAVQFVVVDPPDVSDSWAAISTIDTGTGQPQTAPVELPAISGDRFLCWIFVARWNSFIRIAARSVSLEWVA